jgi:hypothetical protein
MAHKAQIDRTSLDSVGRSYYCFCLENALTAIQQARALMKGDKVETNHELPKIEQLISEALEAS